MERYIIKVPETDSTKLDKLYLTILKMNELMYIREVSRGYRHINDYKERFVSLFTCLSKELGYTKEDVEGILGEFTSNWSSPREVAHIVNLIDKISA